MIPLRLGLGLIIFIIAEVLLFQQNDYTVTNERFEIISLNDKYLSTRFRSIMYNRTYRAINITLTFKQNFSRNIQCVFQAYKFASNEYRLFPIYMKVNPCDILDQDTFGVENIFTCGNFSKCPWRQGTYTICNWAPDQSKFPPHHPRGRFLAEVKLYYLDEQMAEIHWYTKVESKIKWQ